MSKDYYNMLGVSKNAGKDEIKRAYRKLAHQHHPDKNGGDDKKFKEINEAYQILSNDQKRQQYDHFGPAFSANGGQAGFSGQGANWEDIFSAFGQGGDQRFYSQRVNLEDLFSDVFGDFFGGGFARRTRNKNVIVDINLELEDMIKGVEKEIRIDNLAIRLKIKAKVSRGVSKEIKKILRKEKKKS